MATIIRWKLSLTVCREQSAHSFVMIMRLRSPQFCAWNMMLGDEILQCCWLMSPFIFHPVGVWGLYFIVGVVSCRFVPILGSRAPHLFTRINHEENKPLLSIRNLASILLVIPAQWIWNGTILLLNKSSISECVMNHVQRLNNGQILCTLQCQEIWGNPQQTRSAITPPGALIRVWGCDWGR